MKVKTESGEFLSIFMVMVFEFVYLWLDLVFSSVIKSLKELASFNLFDTILYFLLGLTLFLGGIVIAATAIFCSCLLGVPFYIFIAAVIFPFEYIIKYAIQNNKF